MHEHHAHFRTGDPVTEATAAPFLAVRALDYAVGGAHLIHALDLTLARRGCTVVMGPNGSGKSVLLRLLHGLLAPTGGTIRWGGAPLSAQVMRRQALVFQSPVLLRRSAAANVEFVLNCGRAERRARSAAALRRVDLGDAAERPARVLSGGEQQRLALARAMVTEPEVLLMDEPTANLDPASTLTIERIVHELVAAGTRIIFVTHDVAQARRLATDIVFLHRGRLVEHTPARRFFEAPGSRPARDFLAGRIVL